MQFNKYTSTRTHTHTHTHTQRNGDGSGDCSGDGNGDDDKTRIGLGRAEGRRKNARNRKIAVEAVRETGETRVESEKNVEKKGLVW